MKRIIETSVSAEFGSTLMRFSCPANEPLDIIEISFLDASGDWEAFEIDLDTLKEIFNELGQPLA